MKLLTNSKTLIENINSLGINDSEGLIEYLPYRYEVFNYSKEENIKDKDRVVIIGRIVSNPKIIRNTKINIVSFHFISRGNKLYMVKAFNQSYIGGIINLEDEFTLVGRFNYEKNEITLSSLKKGEIPQEERYRPMYHLPSNINDSTYRNLVKRTLNNESFHMEDYLPKKLVSKYHLLSHDEALHSIHFPKNEEDLHNALRTLKFEECMDFCLKNRIVRNRNALLSKKNDIEINTTKINEFIKSLPFKLTEDQTQAIREIVFDMKKEKLMYRLLQGDVGTGKTLVAVIALYANYLRLKQGVLMAPTDALARQHYENVASLLEKYNIHVALVVGSLSKGERKAIIKKIRAGEVDIVVGTHAVFSDDFEYVSLGLAVIDEQHRFGVNQRNKLVNKGGEVDLLLMSATPIPRTLSLSIYGDLEVSTLAKYPNNARKVRTLVVSYESKKITGLIDYCLKNERQVFMVCPKITSIDNDESAVKNVYEKYHDIYGDKIGLLHGKMKAEEKNIILEEFKKKEILILVATSIVELGIDIKEAMGIIIFSANSFGLASLHQLRGRVGRDGNEGYCILVDDGNEDLSRLMFLESCSDGFRIAEEDLRLRGPGDFMGIEQSGFPSFNTLNIVSDFRMFEIARDEVQHIMFDLDDEDNKKYYNKIQNELDMNEFENKNALFD